MKSKHPYIEDKQNADETFSPNPNTRQENFFKLNETHNNDDSY